MHWGEPYSSNPPNDLGCVYLLIMIPVCTTVDKLCANTSTKYQSSLAPVLAIWPIISSSTNFFQYSKITKSAASSIGREVIILQSMQTDRSLSFVKRSWFVSDSCQNNSFCLFLFSRSLEILISKNYSRGL